VTIRERHWPAGSVVLRWALTSLVVAITTGAAFVAVLGAGRAVGFLDASRPAWLLVAAGMVGAIVVAAAGSRRIDAAVVDLVLGVDDQQIAAIAAMEHDLAAEMGAMQYLSELATTTARLVRVPYVAFEFRAVLAGGPADDPDPDESAWSAQLTAAAGTPAGTAQMLTRPVRLGAHQLGVITVGARSQDRRFSVDDIAAVDAIARQAAMVISNARHADALHAARERAVAGIEEERRRLRRDLHDGLGPSLAAMKMRLGMLRRSGGLNTAGSNLVDEIASMVDATTADVRRLVDDLRPPLLDDLGLSDALRCLGFVPPELSLNVESTDDLDDLPAAAQVALYRIGSEAIRNVVRHADATTCDVRLRRDEGAVTLTVIDDGRSIADDPPAGVGLAAMRERADELGGLVTVSRGVDGRGCCIAATIPLRPGTARSSSTTPVEALG